MVNNKRVGIVIQARYSSTRLLGKILLSLPYQSNITLLQQIVNRSKAINIVDEVVIATSKNEENDVLENLANSAGVKLYRGSNWGYLK